DDSPIYTFRQMREGRAPVLQAMLQNMLSDRFKLVVHREMKEMPVYQLTVAKGGPKLAPSRSDDTYAININRDRGTDLLLHGTKTPVANLAITLGLLDVTRPVLDRTALQGEFN